MMPAGERHMNPANRYPGFWHAALLCLIFISVQGMLMAPAAVADMVLHTDLAMHPAVLGVVNLIVCAVVLVLAGLIGKPAWPEVFAFRRVSIWAMAGVLVAMPGAIIMLSELDNLVRSVLPVPDWVLRYFRELTSRVGQRFWGGVFLLVVVAPLTEEVLFRGLILRGFLRRFSPARAFLWSALLFGATHLNPWQFASGSALGVMFAWWYARSRSLIPSLAGHALVNAMAVVQPVFWFKVRGFNAGEPLGTPEFQPLWFDAIGLAFLTAGFGLFWLSTPPIRLEIEPIVEPPPVLAPPVIVAEAAATPPPLPKPDISC